MPNTSNWLDTKWSRDPGLMSVKMMFKCFLTETSNRSFHSSISADVTCQSLKYLTPTSSRNMYEIYIHYKVLCPTKLIYCAKTYIFMIKRCFSMHIPDTIDVIFIARRLRGCNQTMACRLFLLFHSTQSLVLTAYYVWRISSTHSVLARYDGNNSSEQIIT